MWRISFYGVNVKSTSYEVPMHLYICLRWGLFTICTYNWFVGIRLAECCRETKSEWCLLIFCWCDLFRFDLYNCCFIFRSVLSFVSCCHLLRVYLLFVAFFSVVTMWWGFICLSAPCLFVILCVLFWIAFFAEILSTPFSVALFLSDEIWSCCVFVYVCVFILIRISFCFVISHDSVCWDTELL